MRPYERWLNQAWDDLQFARLGLEQGFHAQACFLSQQVIEKCLKGYLVSRGRLYPKTHKLVDLLQLCSEHCQELMPLEGLFRVIDGYYIPARYPDAAPSGEEMSPGAAQAGEAIETAENVYALILRRVK